MANVDSLFDNRLITNGRITLDKDSGTMLLSDVDYTSARDITHYFKEAERLFELYQSCIGNRSIETMAEKYISGMHATGISARGHHYFVPKAYMHKISLLEDFMELLGPENLFEYSNKRDSRYISINSMYVADDEKQRNKMAREFYQDMGREIAEYQSRIAHSSAALVTDIDVDSLVLGGSR